MAQSENHMNAVHKYARLWHRTVDRELRITVLMSGLSFSSEYDALASCRKSVPFGTFSESSDCGELRRNIEKISENITNQFHCVKTKSESKSNVCKKRQYAFRVGVRLAARGT